MRPASARIFRREGAVGVVTSLLALLHEKVEHGASITCGAANLQATGTSLIDGLSDSRNQ